jgi:predicted PurR-regulated permease PerM
MEDPNKQNAASVEETPAAAPITVRIDPSSPSIRSVIKVVVVTLVIVLFAGWVQTIITSITGLVFLIVLSVFFAYLMDPIVQLIRKPFKARSQERLMPRSVAIVCSYVLVFSIIGTAIYAVAPQVVEQGKEFGANAPGYAQSLRARLNDISTRFNRLRVPEEIQTEINRQASEVGGSITASLGNFVLVGVTYLPWLLLIPILGFFFLKDVNLFRLAVLRMFPAGRWRYRAEVVMADVNTTLAAYTRAQLISCVIIAVICTAGFYVIGLKYALLLGILAGIFEFVPLIGPLTIGVIVMTTAAASDNPWKALYVVIFLVLLRIVHDYVTYPRIVRGGIHLHPLAIILSVLAGEQVAGIPGVFISIPIVALGTVIYRHVLEHQGRRGLLSDWIEQAEAEKIEEGAV